MALLALVAGCGRIGIDPVDLPACTAQRAVYIVAGNGSLAWFTLVWPVPEVVTAFHPGYAYDDVGLVTMVVADADHPLYARRALWAEAAHAEPTAIVAGSNETHTETPTTPVEVGGASVIGAGVDAQGELAAPLPALGFDLAAPYLADPVEVADIDGALAALRAVSPVTASREHALRPDPTTLAAWYGPDANAAEKTLAERLLFTANAFRAGLVGTVMIRGIDDDPHGAFLDARVGARADVLAGILRGFQAELADAPEPACVVDGARVSLASNVVVVVFGDTPKDPFAAEGWPDGTPGSSNVVYVRGNGFLRPGWFGSITSTPASIPFDPMTGALDDGATRQADTTAADLAILYAITRGDAAAVAAFAAAPYQGLINVTR